MYCLLFAKAAWLLAIYEHITNCSSVFEHVFQRALPYVSSLRSLLARGDDASGWVQRSPASSWRISLLPAALELCCLHTLDDL